MRIAHIKSAGHTENSLYWNGYVKNANDSKEDCMADVKFDEDEDNGIEDLE
jgi:hypothetical protein